MNRTRALRVDRQGPQEPEARAGKLPDPGARDLGLHCKGGLAGRQKGEWHRACGEGHAASGGVKQGGMQGPRSRRPLGQCQGRF